MEILGTYRGYDIVQTDWRLAGDERAVLVIPGMKDRLGTPILHRVDQARAYIDAELGAREDTADMMKEDFEATLRTRGGSLGIIIPASAARRLGLDAGDVVKVTMRRT